MRTNAFGANAQAVGVGGRGETAPAELQAEQQAAPAAVSAGSRGARPTTWHVSPPPAAPAGAARDCGVFAWAAPQAPSRCAAAWIAARMRG